MCAHHASHIPGVDSVTVIEKSQDVIALVWPTYASHPNMKLIHADAFDWKPPKGKRYTVIWNDIWDDICGDNYEEMKRLTRKYGKRCDWQDCWCKSETKRQSI